MTILPTGMALGVTQQLPMEERHTYPLEYIKDTLCVRMGGRCAEQIVFGTLTTGASNDLQGSTEMAKRMVREFGMSDRIGPMAWGSQGMVFLGEDLMHTRDYSEETSRVIDEEVERILREQEERATEELLRHRKGLDAVAAALLDKETIDGAEVGRLVDTAFGHPVHGEDGEKAVPHFAPTDDRPGSPDREAFPDPTASLVDRVRMVPSRRQVSTRAAGTLSPRSRSCACWSVRSTLDGWWDDVLRALNH